MFKQRGHNSDITYYIANVVWVKKLLENNVFFLFPFFLD